MNLFNKKKTSIDGDDRENDYDNDDELLAEAKRRVNNKRNNNKNDNRIYLLRVYYHYIDYIMLLIY
jgi:hypothetical protein